MLHKFMKSILTLVLLIGGVLLVALPAFAIGFRIAIWIGAPELSPFIAMLLLACGLFVFFETTKKDEK
jgi:uncharacterized RDD family membrane protein YckC